MHENENITEATGSQMMPGQVNVSEQNISIQEKPHNNLKKYLISLLAIFVLVIIAFFSYYFYTKVSQNSTKHINTTTVKLQSTGTQTNILNVNFSPRELIATASASQEVEYWDGNYTMYSVGKIVTGKYQGGDLIDVDTLTGTGACKSYACSQDNTDRYIKMSDKFIFLPKISQDKVNSGSYSYLPTASIISQALFGKTGVPQLIDNTSTIPILEYPAHLNEINPTMSLDYGDSEQDGTPDATLLMPVFSDPVFGKIYTTKPGLGPQDSYYASIANKNSVGNPHTGGIGYCHGTACYTNNAFFVFRPDGTFLLYTYTPPFFKTENGSSIFDSSQINWNSGITITANYSPHGTGDCARETLDEIGVIDPSKISANDIVQLGTVKKSGDAIFGLKDSNNSLIANFYNNYKAEISTYQSYNVEDYPTIQPYNSFSSQYPILVWKDPLGRYIRLANQNLIPPSECEPIIYLYPQQDKENISIKFGNIVHLTSSVPEYNDGWSISAFTNGTIINTNDDKTYPYLFWEGYSTFFPKKKDGFIVKTSEVRNFFIETLPKLGLNTKESSDFIKVWLPSFNSSPYYFITFYDTQTLNQLVPFEITPKPDTLIRIMMDYLPLQKPITVSPFVFPQVLPRKGFTVVEWGSLK